MRTLPALFIGISLFLFYSCEKADNVPEVESYVDQLRSNSYGDRELPPFQAADITALLEYRNDTTTITDYPHNMLSSLWLPECKLGVYVLWTIESIRAVAIDSEYLIGSFPSLNPVLAYRDSSYLVLSNEVEAQTAAAAAYYSWWNSGSILETRLKTDPLAESEYRWH